MTDGADGRTVASLRKACEGAGAAVTIVAPTIGGVSLTDGTVLPADGQLSGTPSVLFDANAFIHLKAIAFSEAARPLLDRAGVKNDEGVVPAERGGATFAAAAATRQWAREARVRPAL